MTKIAAPSLTKLLEVLPGGSGGDAARQIKRAHQFAAQAHAGFHRRSGEAYIEHDLGVADIMTNLGVDTVTIVTAVLHDILLPHTGVTEEMVRNNFGEEVTTLVLSLRKVFDYSLKRAQQEEEEEQKQPEEKDDKKKKKQSRQKSLERLRRGILSLVEWDIRVILILMADILENLRHADNLEREEQIEVASDAMHIYAPLANRLGIWQLKWELEDLSFRYLEPVQYQAIAQKLSARRADRTEKIEAAATRLQRKIDASGFKGTVTGRPKHIYSIYRKMKRKKVDIEHIYDIQALRVILEPSDPEAYQDKTAKEQDEVDHGLCYQVLGLVHGLWQPIPREFDDYIAVPKPNGYKSLHTAVMDAETGQTLEVQIRTLRMHEEAEKGVAAHWAYKEVDSQVSASVQRRIQNLRELLHTLIETEDLSLEKDLMDVEDLDEHIYVFTPKGDIFELTAGSTPIDFAYQIHTIIGHRCRGARVNGKMVSLDYKLQSGDKVEIITGKRPNPSRNWMNASLGYAANGRTRSKIRRWFRQQEREKNIEQGREAIERELKRLSLSDTYTIEEIAKTLKYEDVDEFLAKVGFGDVQSNQISGAIAILRRKLRPDDNLQPLLQPSIPKPQGITVTGMSGLHIRMAGCCNPIPPEGITGYVTRGHGVTIHCSDCKQIQNPSEPERLIEVDWGMDDDTYPIPIVVEAYRRPGLIDEMSAILRGQGINVPQTKRTTSGSYTTVYMVAEVTDMDQLTWLLNKLENLPNVVMARRQNWS